MHRLLERLDGAASTIVPLAYLAGMLLGTAAYFSGLVLDAGVAVGVALACAVELHGFLEQRRVRALWGAYSRTPDGEARDRVFGELRAHAVILGALVLFQAYNSLQFLGATWRPSPGTRARAAAAHHQRALVLPAAFLVSGALSPLTVDAGDELRHAARAMLHRTLRATLRQWKSRIDRAARSQRDLAPIAVSLMLDAGDTDGARRITLIAEGLATSERAPTVIGAASTSSVRTGSIEAPERPPTGPGSPVAACCGASAQADGASARSQHQGGIHALPAPKRAKGVRTPNTRTVSAEAKVRRVWRAGISVKELARLAQMSESTASKWAKVLRDEPAREVAAL